jgi:hypothetical protein
MPKSLKSRFKKYTYKTCDDLKHLSGRDIIRLNPSLISWDINSPANKKQCNSEQKFALDYIIELKGKKKTMTSGEYASEVKDTLKEFNEMLDGAGNTSFINTAKIVSHEIQGRKSSSAKGIRRRRRRQNTKKKRKL